MHLKKRHLKKRSADQKPNLNAKLLNQHTPNKKGDDSNKERPLIIKASNYIQLRFKVTSASF